MAGPSCSLMRWMLMLGPKRTGTSWLVSTLLRMFSVVTAVRCWVGSMNVLMKNHRNTRKGSSYLRSPKLSRKTGNLWVVLCHCPNHVVSVRMLPHVCVVQKILLNWKYSLIVPSCAFSLYLSCEDCIGDDWFCE